MDDSIIAGIVLTLIVVAMSIVMLIYGTVIPDPSITGIASPKAVLISFGSIGLASVVAYWLYVYFRNQQDINHDLESALFPQQQQSSQARMNAGQNNGYAYDNANNYADNFVRPPGGFGQAVQ